MTDKRTIGGTVTTEADGPARVAFDLMVRIAHTESDKTRDREYYLRLFAQCRMVAGNPYHLEDALKLAK